MTQNPDRDSQSPLYRCIEGGGGGLVLYIGAMLRCVTLSKYWADIRLINVLFAIFYIFIHFIEFPQDVYSDFKHFCVFDQILACLVLEIIAT